ncbi:asparaginase [Microbacterium sp. RD1]|uniref:asparaginase n=1 Tax=Microbacterium sp. RD1 TaxID=3457313 RepID=UPI003FA5977A
MSIRSVSDEPHTPRVRVIGLGGTIASTAAAGEPGVSPRLGAASLLEALPPMPDVELSATSFRQMPSSDLTMKDVIALADEIRSSLDEGSDGVVITQGTSTIEEVAFAVDLLVRSPKPIVFTGAMRNPALPGADGPANLLAAIRVARSCEARNLGSVVVMNDEIHAARCVRKSHTSNPGAFQSFGVGPLGWVSEQQPVILTRPAPLQPLPDAVRDDAPSVALLRMALGDDGRLIGTVTDLGYQGLVVEGFGGGHVPRGVVSLLEQTAARIPVVLSSRTGAGTVLSRTYGFAGSEQDLLARGLVSAQRLDGPKARVLLTLCLQSRSSTAEVADHFRRIAASA